MPTRRPKATLTESLPLEFGAVRLPGPLLDAAEADNLVVFAGTGVSMGPPSNIEDYNGLAKKIRGTVPLDPIDGERPESYLGRLQARKVNVHERARVHTTPKDSAPTVLHHDLLRLFGGVEGVRIVTTNYDEHFETASAAVFGAEPRVYVAPALPRGADFNGVVHLHGRALDRAGPIVLTDVDFGQAYLTEGWARDFLMGVYAKYTVLFVGYSHGDTMLSYMARGLPGGACPRYALAKAGEGTDWLSLGIREISYPSTPDHRDLQLVIKRWVGERRLDYIDRDLRVERIALEFSNDPEGMDVETASLLRRTVRAETGARMFTRHARSVSWLRWAENEGVLDGMFREEAGEVQDAIWARWVLREYTTAHRGETRALLARRGTRLPRRVARSIARTLQTAGTGDPETLRFWAPYLIEAGVDDEVAVDLLEAAMQVREIEVALLALGRVLRPRAVSRENPFFGVLGEEASPDGKTLIEPRAASAVGGASEVIGEVWAWAWDVADGGHRERLVEIAADALKEGHRIARSVALDRHERDDWTRRIDDRDETDARVAFDLIDSAMQDATWVTGERLDETRESWLRSEAPTLIRLALRSLRRDIQEGRGDAGAAVQLLLDREWLTSLALDPDSVELLQIASEQAIPHIAEAAATAVEVGVERGETHLFHGLRVLEAVAGDGARAAERRLSALLPQADATATPPLDGDALLSATPEDVVDDLLRRIAEERGSFSDVSRTVADVVRRHPQWGLGLARALDRRGARAKRLWYGVYDGWSGATNDGWGATLAFLRDAETIPVPGKTAHVVARRLRDAVKRSTLAASGSLIAVIGRALDAAIEAQEVDVVGLAAQAARFMHQHSLDTSVALGALQTALSWQSEGVWSKLGVELHDLAAVDEDWVRLNVLPATSREAPDDAIRKAARLAVFHENNQPDSLAADILRSAVDALPEIEWTETQSHWEGPSREALTSVASDVVETLAGAAYRWPRVALGEWCGTFFFYAPPLARAAWVREFGVRLQHTDVAAAWAGWLKAYWCGRLEGDPAPLSSEEAGELLAWARRREIPLAELAEIVLEGPEPLAVSGHAASAWMDRADEAPEVALSVLTRIVEAGEALPVYKLPEAMKPMEKAPVAAQRGFLNALTRAGVLSGQEALTILGEAA